eukprot:gb/GECG01008078.1/.p1 GENE.gb/GECG01008078.1/~~gb/GECG01008078.1/.p1  ORF type:complete len:104 (+),score=6.24 gb/GECG01008078.1/:1-312(+)
MALMKANLILAYLCWLTLGIVGLHHYYLGDWGRGCTYTCTLGLCLYGWIKDCPKIPALVEQCNENLVKNYALDERVVDDSTYHFRRIEGFDYEDDEGKAAGAV